MFPKNWFSGLDIDKMIVSQKYDKKINKYGVKCGSSLEAWESSGWIDKQDPYGWFQWYCRFYRGRRTKDDRRQIDRWLKLAGPKGRFRNRLLNMIKKKNLKKMIIQYHLSSDKYYNIGRIKFNGVFFDRF